MSLKQRTINKEVSASGIALHSGQETCITLLPASIDSGVLFRRVDLEGRPEIRADYHLITDLLRNTTLESGYIKISTVEHVLSALMGCGIDNVVVELDGAEPPIFDGSARRFVELIEEAGPVEQKAEKKIYSIEETITVEDGDRSIVACPYDGFKITCTFADEKGKFTQHLSLDIDSEVYASEIAGARTFTFYEDIEGLIKKGKIKGGSLDSAIVIKEDKVMVKEPLRFEDELVRHKILDIVGDLSLLGRPVRGHIIAIKPGHAINSKLTAKIGEKFATSSKAAAGDAVAAKTEIKIHEKTEMDIKEVMAHLPHRYPFLLVDRVLEIGESEITALKNVTINEPYFNGHFPGKPVMPGVLQVEAMAQVAGILLLNIIKEKGKIALFMSCDKVKFRKVVTPGDQLEIKAEMLKIRGKKMGIAKAACYVGETMVSSAELTFALTDEE